METFEQCHALTRAGRRCRSPAKIFDDIQNIEVCVHHDSRRIEARQNQSQYESILWWKKRVKDELEFAAKRECKALMTQLTDERLYGLLKNLCQFRNGQRLRKNVRALFLAIVAEDIRRESTNGL